MSELRECPIEWRGRSRWVVADEFVGTQCKERAATDSARLDIISRAVYLFDLHVIMGATMLSIVRQQSAP